MSAASKALTSRQCLGGTSIVGRQRRVARAIIRVGRAEASLSNQTLDPMVTTRSRLGGVNRAVALALAIVWLCAGVAGIVLGFVHGPLLLVAIALFAIWYAALWFRVVARSRLLTWRELATPWRSK